MSLGLAFAEEYFVGFRRSRRRLFKNYGGLGWFVCNSLNPRFRWFLACVPPPFRMKFLLECLEHKRKRNGGSVPVLLLLFWFSLAEEPFCSRLYLSIIRRRLLWLEGRNFQFLKQFNGNCRGDFFPATVIIVLFP